MKSMGQYIKLARVNSGISQSKLADEVGVTKTYVSLLENDRKDASVDLLKKIAKLLNVPVFLLLWQKLDIPSGSNKEEREIKEQLDTIASKAQELFARNLS